MQDRRDRSLIAYELLTITGIINNSTLAFDVRNARMTCEKTKCCGPGYASPKEAINGPREKVLFVMCPHTKATGHDMLAAIDVDPTSDTYLSVLSRVDFPHESDEVHHSGWNTCSSCFGNVSMKRTHLILPCLNSDRIYIVNVENEKDMQLEVTIEPELVHEYNVSFPHTAHCLADGEVMISMLGDAEGNNKGNFLLLDGKTFKPRGCWLDDENTAQYNYDFWYQPRRDVMISTEWGIPKIIKNGFDPKDVLLGRYGHSVNLYKWSTHEKLQTIELPVDDGSCPFEVRFKHDPASPYAFFGTVLGSCIYMMKPEAEIFLQSPSDKYVATRVVKIPMKQVEGWILPEMPSLIADIVISMDDRFLYLSNYIHGDVRQYDITDPENVRMTGQVFVGGSIHTESGVKILKDDELKEPPPARYVKGKRIEGGPQMLQLSLDGRRLYVTTSLYRLWDEQFYPKLIGSGASMLRLDVAENGGMTLDENFLVDFGAIEGGPYLAHEMRYPGGDCTSDIWI